MATQTTNLPEPVGIKPLEIDAHSVYLRWAILSSHGLNNEELTALSFEIKTTDNRLRGECTENSPLHEYKARLYGLSSDKKYRFVIRSKLVRKSSSGKEEILYSKWSNRVELETGADELVIISNEKELDTISLKHQLKNYMNENRKLKLQIEQLKAKLADQNEESGTPGHYQWDEKKIVNWVMRIQGGMFKEYKKLLLKNLKEEGIKGKDLVMIEETNLKSWGITNFQHRKVLMHNIQQLTEHDKKPEYTFNPELAKMLTVAEDNDELATVNEEVKEEEAEAPKRNKSDEQTKDEPEADEPKQEEAKKEEQDKSEKVEKEDGDNKEEKVKEKEEEEEPTYSGGLSKSVTDLLYDKPEPKSWKYKEGMLSVTVVKAINVDNKDDKSMFESGQSDPYVELELKGNYKKEKTKAVDDDANPVWNEKFQLFVDNAKTDVLKARIYDHDKWGMDDKVGEVQIPVITVLGANGFLRKEYDVVGSKTGCKLTLEMKYWEASRM